MLFEVWKDGHCKMGTDYMICAYPPETLKSMSKEGYTFKLRDKKISLKALLEDEEYVKTFKKGAK